jgi:ribosomal protein L9
VLEGAIIINFNQPALEAKFQNLNLQTQIYYLTTAMSVSTTTKMFQYTQVEQANANASTANEQVQVTAKAFSALTDYVTNPIGVNEQKDVDALSIIDPTTLSMVDQGDYPGKVVAASLALKAVQDTHQLDIKTLQDSLVDLQEKAATATTVATQMNIEYNAAEKTALTEISDIFKTHPGLEQLNGQDTVFITRDCLARLAKMNAEIKDAIKALSAKSVDIAKKDAEIKDAIKTLGTQRVEIAKKDALITAMQNASSVMVMPSGHKLVATVTPHKAVATASLSVYEQYKADCASNAKAKQVATDAEMAKHLNEQQTTGKSEEFVDAKTSNQRLDDLYAVLGGRKLASR